MLVIHIGRHKCGSSSIQQFMSCNAEELRNLGVLYPNTGRSRHAHHQLTTQLCNGGYADIDSIISLNASHPEAHIVVSSEGLCLLDARHIVELRRRIGRQDVMIVIYIRDLAGWISSAYNESTKSGINLRDFDEFYLRRDLSNGLKILYCAEQWGQSFGWENIRVRSLDERSLCGGNLINDFLSIFGLSLENFGGANAQGLEPQNVSNGWKVLEVLRAQFGQLALDSQNYEIRKNHSRIRRRTATGLRDVVIRIMTELNINLDRAQYISARQWHECNESYAREVEKLNRVLIGPQIPITEPTLITERPFLPTIQEISVDERRAIAQRLHGAVFPRFLRESVVAQARTALCSDIGT